MEQKVDKLKHRRRLAYGAAIYSLIIWPNLLISYHLQWELPDSIINNMLLYVGTLSTGPIGAYIWAANKKDVNDANTSRY